MEDYYAVVLNQKQMLNNMALSKDMPTPLYFYVNSAWSIWETL